MCDIFFDTCIAEQKQPSTSSATEAQHVAVRGQTAQRILRDYRALVAQRGTGYRSPELEIRALVDAAITQQFEQIEEPSDRLWLLKEFYETGAEDQRKRLFYGYDFIKITHSLLPRIKCSSEKHELVKWTHDTISKRMTSTKAAPYVRPVLSELWACVKSITDHRDQRREMDAFIQRAGQRFRFSPVWGATTQRVHHPVLLARANVMRFSMYGAKPEHPSGFQMGYWLSYGLARLGL